MHRFAYVSMLRIEFYVLSFNLQKLPLIFIAKNQNLSTAMKRTLFSDWSPKGSGPYALRSLACAGTESKLINCIHADFFKPSVYCREDNFDDVGLVCVPNRSEFHYLQQKHV